jgi:hypothetical protein
VNSMLLLGLIIVAMTVVSTYVIHHMVEDRDSGGLLQFIIFMIGLTGSVTHAASLYLP